MSYPRRPYIVVRSCGHRLLSEPETEGVHAVSPHPTTVPCGPGKKPDIPEPKRISRFNWMGMAEVDNPAFRSSIDAYRASKRAKRPPAMIALAVVLLLVALGVGIAGFISSQSTSEEGGVVRLLTGVYPGLSQAGEAGGFEKTASTPVSDWKKGAIPRLFQQDAQWASSPYASATIGTSGQAPLCFAMALVSLTGSQDVRPVDIAKTIETGGFTRNGKTDPACITENAEALGLRTLEVPLDEMSIRRQLVAGKPILCVMGPGNFTDTGTFILLSNIDMDSKLTVRDPASEARTSQSWDFSTIIDQAESMTALSALPDTL